MEEASVPLERAAALTELGALLRSTNHRREARQHLVEALDVAHRAEARPLASRKELQAGLGSHERSRCRRPRAPTARASAGGSDQPRIRNDCFSLAAELSPA